MDAGRDVYRGWEQHYQESLTLPAWQESADSKVLEFARRALEAKVHRIHVADFGSGDGRNLWPWLEAGAFVTAVDIAPTALRKIARATLARGVTCPTLVCCGLEDLPLAEDQFDFAQCIDALPQVTTPAVALERMARTLRPGGELLFNVFTPADCAFGEGEQLEEDAFVYRGTLFRFFDEPAISKQLPAGIEVLDVRHERWEDPPHGPFRPRPHIHDGLYFRCRRAD